MIGGWLSLGAMAKRADVALKRLNFHLLIVRSGACCSIFGMTSENNRVDGKRLPVTACCLSMGRLD
jgi:hypothetical protein